MCFSIVQLFNSASQINSKYYIPCLLATDPLDRIISSIVRGKCWHLLASWSKILLLLSWSSLTSGGSGQQKTRWWKQHDVQAWLTSPVLSFSQQRDQQSHWQEWCSTWWPKYILIWFIWTNWSSNNSTRIKCTSAGSVSSAGISLYTQVSTCSISSLGSTISLS